MSRVGIEVKWNRTRTRYTKKCRTRTEPMMRTRTSSRCLVSLFVVKNREKLVFLKYSMY